MIESLDKKWKEFLYSASGFGPNFLMVLMGAYYTDAINPAALGHSDTYQAIMSGTCFILPAVFPILFAIGKIFDGIIDIPFAQLTDTLKTKWGRRRPLIAVCFLPMVLSYAFCWIPVGGAENPLLNTIWFFCWALVFFASYTMCLICFYGSLASVCSDEGQRIRVSGYKSFFDTVNYCFVYALVPVLLDAFKVHIDKFALRCIPIMATILIPVFIIKEGEKYGYPEGEPLDSEKVPLLKSFKLTLTNKVYTRWLTVECLTVIGLQMFLVSMNAIMIGSIGFNGTQMAIANTCAFGPVPLMLYLFNKVKKKKGTRFTYRTCLAAFSVAILNLFFASRFVLGNNRPGTQMAIAIVGGIIGSWAIGSFFMMPYMAASSVSSVETKLYGINHSAMYFAAEAVVTSIVGAIASSLIYENIKMFFISKPFAGIVYAHNQFEAAGLFGVSADMVFNLGTLIVPLIVTISCVCGIIAARKMPKDFSEKCIALEYKKLDPDLDISFIESAEEKEDKNVEIVFVQIILSILTGFIFGFFWVLFMFKSISRTIGKKQGFIKGLLSVLIPFVSIPVLLNQHKELKKIADEKNIKLKGRSWVFILTGILFPVLPLNIISLAFMQSDLNRILEN